MFICKIHFEKYLPNQCSLIEVFYKTTLNTRRLFDFSFAETGSAAPEYAFYSSNSRVYCIPISSASSQLAFQAPVPPLIRPYARTSALFDGNIHADILVEPPDFYGNTLVF